MMSQHRSKLITPASTASAAGTIPPAAAAPRWWWRPPPGNPPIGPGELLDEINAFRRRHGRAALDESECLSGQSQQHCQQMSAAEQSGRPGSGLSHSGFESRLIACGNPAGSETVAWGEMTESDVVDLWLRSTSGHRQIMLGDWTVCGVGQFAWYWCAIYSFSAEPGQPPAPARCETCGQLMP